MKKAILLALAATTALAGAAWAASDDAGGKSGMRHGHRAMIERMDTDDSGSVEKGEFAAFVTERAGKRFEAIDSDGDGMISRAEFDAATAERIDRRFARMDSNDDGKLDRDDRHGRGHHGRHHHKDGDGKGGSKTE